MTITEQPTITRDVTLVTTPRVSHFLGDIPVVLVTERQRSQLTLHIPELRMCKACNNMTTGSWCSTQCRRDEDGDERYDD